MPLAPSRWMSSIICSRPLKKSRASPLTLALANLSQSAEETAQEHGSRDSGNLDLAVLAVVHEDAGDVSTVRAPPLVIGLLVCPRAVVSVQRNERIELRQGWKRVKELRASCSPSCTLIMTKLEARAMISSLAANFGPRLLQAPHLRATLAHMGCNFLVVGEMRKCC